MDFIDLFERGSAWSAAKIPADADRLDGPTPCDEWDVRTLLNHMVDSLRYFTEAANDPEHATLPAPDPPDTIGDDPVQRYAAARDATLAAYREPGVVERTGPSLAIAFADQLVHGWDLAEATGQDTTMPPDLAQAAFQTVDGRMPPDKRGSAFKPEVPVPEDAPAQERLLGYVGRKT
jgi:uncharacterized protein (TIGR03086 family)